jgi:ketosteroid isomerase-like protein
MSKMKNYVILLIIIFTSCINKLKIDTEIVKEEIKKAEEAFNAMAADKGLKEAFLSFATEDAVLNRGQNLIKGKDAIANYFDSQSISDVKLSWHPEFVDVAKSGELGYTYGPFVFSGIDTSGNDINAKGFFHTVWKKQNDGTWKFVYD